VTDLAADLARFDTPTICNALELIDPALRGRGVTTRGFVAGPGWAGPGRAICGPAATARIEAASPGPSTDPTVKSAFYRGVAARPGCVVVIEDVDPEPRGAFWGEVHSAVHRRLGARGAITNGVIRDLGDLDPGFLLLGGAVAPSHHHVRWVDHGAGASVFGLTVAEGDLVHADAHGAVRIPAEARDSLPEAVAAIRARERPMLDWARRGGPPDLDALDRLIGAPG
jgi:regulator of RNase E activity RraA